MAILKAGAFETVSKALNVTKLHKHSHLYTSEKLMDFPGRQFKIQKIIPFNKKAFAKENITKANFNSAIDRCCSLCLVEDLVAKFK